MEKDRLITESGVALSVKRTFPDSGFECEICADSTAACIIHWGVRRRRDTSWQVPPSEFWPEGSSSFGKNAVQSPLNGHGCVTIRTGMSDDFHSIEFVLYFPDQNRWDNNRGKNYRIDIRAPRPPYEAPLVGGSAAEIAEEIIDHETSRNSWTLMHRFNLCHDLLDKAKDTEDGLAFVFVWLRYSFIRQLDWQRNYNTQPRELGHSMDRLTLKLAGLYRELPERRETIRLIMSTLGRGSDAQRVRDEVLNIMHRHHIKEVSGHFMEEWHQKLHNNTTPDDIVICEAYLEFMRSNGSLEKFYQTLGDNGVTKERLENYERPIRSHPDFVPHLKDALIRDFEHFLGILKAVHSGTDLGTAIHTARYLFDGEMHQIMDFIWHHRDNRAMPASQFMWKITDARRRIQNLLTWHQDGVRDLLFLDIALEDFLRIAVERSVGPGQTPDELVEIAQAILENLCMSDAGEELPYIRKHWERLGKMQRFEREWSLRAKAVSDRMAAVVGDSVDRLIRLLQPKADFLGKAFHAAPWAVGLFSEEVVRGRPVFALSLVLRYLDPVLRKSGHMGDWQVISMGAATAEVEVAASLQSVQGRSFPRPVVIVTDAVSGNEEIPEGVVAIITAAVIDILAHLSVRARNSRILFATCYDSALIENIKSLRGRTVRVETRGGDVSVEESAGGGEVIASKAVPVRRMAARPSFTSYALTINEFDEDKVGGKSNHLRRLRGKLPGWIGLPASAAIPFGAFERVLEEEINADVAAEYQALLSRAEEAGAGASGVLADLQKSVLRLRAPGELSAALRNALAESGLEVPAEWEDVWTCVKEVWASKWNERAYLSRKANHIPHDNLFMAVLIQNVIEAEYSYVIHTVNPLTGTRGEIYAEAVKGLGEALVGNYPGKAFSFICRQDSAETKTLSFPAKRMGLFGKGLIFRSDSNGEDLAGFAGAGLYDSFILPAPAKITLDYEGDPLVWDDSFRKEFSSHIGKIGASVEHALGAPQDIEGAYAKGTYYVVQTRPQVGI